jgi:hypothetical protein
MIDIEDKVFKELQKYVQKLKKNKIKEVKEMSVKIEQ